VRCSQAPQDAKEHESFGTGAGFIQVLPQRFAVGSCYALQLNHEHQFVGPKPYQCHAAFSPWAAAVGMRRNPVARQASCCLQANGMASLRPHIHHALSASNQCCLTRRSTGPATAGGVSLARSGFATVARQAYTACLRGPVSSNVRPHKRHMARAPSKPSKPSKPAGSDRLWRTPLHYAAADAKLEEMKSLLSIGLDVNNQDKNGWSPLHFAAQSQSEEVTKLLLNAGANVDAQDSHGNTALFRAVFCCRGDGKVIELLRSHGANPSFENHYGVSPVGLASTIANYDIARFFIDVADTEVSSPRESHPQALPEPDVNLSIHPAPIVQSS